ncbi:conserved oligomeric Golgi complex subunit 2-like isoform X2 [Artemia franciscana]|uniref:Conserved oligomeric Golgi complex subunit 2 n=1 Tax=Artemia franciscana TaxID=6661 RepID=A0AA88HC35_ARTSF|nr:hypothetical protein QYM36_015365 [Artemia franciscana]
MPAQQFEPCFEERDFFQTSFNPDQFLQKYQPVVSLDTLKEDLDTFHKDLRASLIGVINEDYQDFIGLASNLIGLETLTRNLKGPFTTHLEQLKVLQASLREALRDIEKCKEDKDNLKRKAGVAKCRTEIERICHGNINERPTERLVAELAYLRVLMEQWKKYISEEEKTLLSNLEEITAKKLSEMLAFTLKSQNRDESIVVLNFFILLGFNKTAEESVRLGFVRPLLEKLFETNTFGNEPAELDRFFFLLRNTIIGQFRTLLEISIQYLSYRGSTFSILINSLWPEIAAKVKDFDSLFSTLDMDHFQQRYLLTMNFLNWYEDLCGSYETIAPLKLREDYLALKNGWNYSAYYQARFQEIAGKLELALENPFNTPMSTSNGDFFKLASTSALWASLQACWSPNVFIPPLTHRFWKLTFQLLSRYNTWLQGLLEMGAKIAIEDWTKIYADIIELDRKLDLVKEMAFVKSQHPGNQLWSKLQGAFKECRSVIFSHREKVLQQAVGLLKDQSAVHLENITDIPRLYRRTNRVTPSTHCSYIDNAFQPLISFKVSYGEEMGDIETMSILEEVVCSILASYSAKVKELLESVAKTEESLKRFRKTREKTPTTQHISSGPSDEDKIRNQVSLDAQRFCSHGHGRRHELTNSNPVTREKLQSVSQSALFSQPILIWTLLFFF